MPNLETEEEEAERIAKTSALNKFNNKINNFDEMFKNKEDEFNEIFKDKEKKLSTKLNKLNNDVKKLKNYIEENNNEKIVIKKQVKVKQVMVKYLMY